MIANVVQLSEQLRMDLVFFFESLDNFDQRLGVSED